MIFGEVAWSDAEGAVLAHSLKAGERRFAKGHVVTAADIDFLRHSGIDGIIAARLEPDDLMEDEAAGRIAAAIDIDGMRLSPPSTGRVNVFSRSNGLFRADKALIDRLNRIDPAITLACLHDHADVKAGDMVATIKIIPLAVSGRAVEEAVRLLGSGRAFEVKPYRPHRVALIATMLPSLKLSVMDKTRALLDRRLEASGSRIDREERVGHDAASVASAIGATLAHHDMIIVFGASAVTDPGDVIPEAIRIAGGHVDQVGLPVDPGNLLVLGHVDGKPVIGAPGCARSPKENAFDWVLSRIFAGETPSREDLSGLGVGGLLMEIPTRPRPRLGGETGEAPLHVAAVVLAAGQATRMAQSGKHKLLAEFDGVPLVRKSVTTALEAGLDRVVTVTGHRAGEIEAVLAGLDGEITFNPDYATGMASSLRTGLAAIRAEADGMLVLLADMPAITADDLRRMVEAFRAEQGRAIIRAVAGGKRGNPVILPASVFDAVARLEGDIGARPIIERSGLAVVDVEIGDAAHVDTDTPEAILAAGGVLTN
jgi:molybdenum cofactor cytidylyltransferase